MTVIDRINEVSKRIESEGITVEAKAMENGHVLVSFTGDTYPVKETLKKRFHAFWSGADKCWNVEVSGYNRFWNRGQWIIDMGAAEEMKSAIGEDIWCAPFSA